jgi:hypothetical protein
MTNKISADQYGMAPKYILKYQRLSSNETAIRIQAMRSYFILIDFGNTPIPWLPIQTIA